MMKSKIVKKVILQLGILMITPLIGVLLLCMVYSLPVSSMMNHVMESVDYLQNAGRSINGALADTNFDRWTNSVMVNEAICENGGNVIEEALLANYYITGSLAEDSPYDTLLAFAQGDKDNIITVSYERYWHGYLVFLKPLLFIFSLKEVVHFIAVLQIICSVFIVMKLAQTDKRLVFIYTVYWLCLSPATVMYSFQYSTMYFIISIALICLLQYSKEMEERGLFFVFYTVLGIITSFMDFLTYPIVGLGIILLFHVLLRRSNVYNIIWNSIAWGIGYGTMWVGKWLIGGILLKEDLLGAAIGTAKWRMSSVDGSGTGITYLDVIKCNFSIYQPYFVILLAALLIFMVIYIIVRKNFKADLKGIVSLLIIALIPFAWYLAVKNHSYIHPFMTYRDLSITFAAISGIPYMLTKRT